jgi:hypothetical protein
LSHPVAQRLAALRRRRGADGAATCEAVRDLVVVVSSSRGGSSLFAALLRGAGALLHTSAEVNPHVVIATGCRSSCEALADPAAFADVAVLRGELGLDVGQPLEEPDDVAAFADQVTWRLTMQWPEHVFDPDGVARDVRGTLDQLGYDGREAFFARLLSRYPAVVAGAYDGLDARPPHAPPGEPVVEMRPFVVPRPWRRTTLDEAATLPLLLVTPRNVFRLPLLAAAFPNAPLRLIHLTRNPAAAANGLLDGWRHWGFASCRLDHGRWWHYDVPPGWGAWLDRPLVEVCGFQWRAAHEAALDAAARYDTHRVHFEDVVGPVDRRRQVLAALGDWLGAGAAEVTALADTALPVVMPTEDPRPARWRANAGELAPLLSDPATLDLAERLGYAPDPTTWT